MKVKKVDAITAEEVAALCDHTFLKRVECYSPTAGQSALRLFEQDFFKFMNESIQGALSPFAICVRPEYVQKAHNFIDQSKKRGIKIVSVAGFPDGSITPPLMKLFEANFAIDRGAEEIDGVINAHALKRGDHSFVLSELKGFVEVCRRKGIIFKLILEISELSHYEIEQACRLAEHAGVDFLKTSTGFGTFGARVDEVRLMRENFSGGIKVSGGITLTNLYPLLVAASGQGEKRVVLDPMKVRVGASRLLQELSADTRSNFSR